MKVIYTRTMRVKDDKLDEAMKIGKGLAVVRKNTTLNTKFTFHFKWEEIQEQ